jgi:hypothetical protein
MPFFAVGGFVGSVCQWGSVDGLRLPDKPLLAERIYRLSDCGPPPGVCARRGRGHGAFYDFLGAYLGEAYAALGRA